MQNILLWQEGVHLESNINDEKQKSFAEQIGVYKISMQSVMTSQYFKDTMIKDSTERFGYTPMYPATTEVTITKKTARDRNDEPCTHQIGTYMLANALTALDIHSTTQMIKTIKRTITGADPRWDQTQNTGLIKESDILHAKRELKDYIISEIDKNTGQLYAHCPALELTRLRDNIINCDNFDNRIGLTSKFILDGIHEKYRRLNLHKIAPWTNGTLPYMYCTPKHKDPIKKTRIIASYFRYPLKKLYKLASKAGTWLLRSLPEKYRHFTLHKVGDVKKRLHEGLKQVTKQYKDNTEIISFQTDVKQMYTFLCPQEIRKAITWLFEIMKTTCPKRSPYNTILAVSKAMDTKFPENVRWGRGTDEEHTVTMTFKNLQDIYDLDLDYSFSTTNGVVSYQSIGCPIGGFLSAFYANTVCAYHEWQLLQSLGSFSDNIYGIRQMDDLLVWIATEKNDDKTKIKAHSLKRKFLKTNGVYKGGLELEEEKVQIQWKQGMKHFVHEFAGVHITVRARQPTVECTTLDKNEANIREGKGQIIARYPPWNSYTTEQSKKGVIMGTIHRIKEQNSSSQLAAQSLYKNYLEYREIGYPTQFYKDTLGRMTARSKDKDIIDITTATTKLITDNETGGDHAEKGKNKGMRDGRKAKDGFKTTKFCKRKTEK